MLRDSKLGKFRTAEVVSKLIAGIASELEGDDDRFLARSVPSLPFVTIGHGSALPSRGRPFFNDSGLGMSVHHSSHVGQSLRTRGRTVKEEEDANTLKLSRGRFSSHLGAEWNGGWPEEPK